MMALSFRQAGQALIGLAIVQLALPKILPLPGISARWWLFILEGGGFGRLATFVGGTLVAIWGLSLIPLGLTTRQLTLLSALAAVLSRLIAILVLGLGLGISVAWWPNSDGSAGLVLGLLLVALCYGGVATGVGWVMARAKKR